MGWQIGLDLTYIFCSLFFKSPTSEDFTYNLLIMLNKYTVYDSAMYFIASVQFILTVIV